MRDIEYAYARRVETEALRIEISGHTDTTGTPEKTLVLSKERAEAVKLYMAGPRHRTGAHRDARRAGPNEPVADNSTKEGRTMNRRIEFKLIQKPDATDAAMPAPAPDAADAPPAPPMTPPAAAPPAPGSGLQPVPAPPH